MNTRNRDSKTFHLLLNRQRKNMRHCIQNLNIGDKTVSGEHNIMEGFKTHFANLAISLYNENFDYSYSSEIEQEIDIITKITQNTEIPMPTREEIYKAIQELKLGKAPDISN